MSYLNSEIRSILANSFLLHTTFQRESDGKQRTIETTFTWDKGHSIFLSGFPGKRDWVASMMKAARVTVQTVETSASGLHYQLSGHARVLRDRQLRMPHLLDFIDHWSKRGSNYSPFRIALTLIKLNHRLKLPWWGPFYLARNILDRMPCVEIILDGQYHIVSRDF